MPKKIIPTSGARSSVSDSSEYNKMDSYHEEEKRLRAELDDLRYSNLSLKSNLESVQRQRNELKRKQEEYDKVVNGRDESVSERDRIIYDLEEMENKLSCQLSELQGTNQTLLSNANQLEKKLGAEIKLSKSWRHREKKLIRYTWITTLLGIAGTIWGSLGNPLPSVNDNDVYISPSGKTANEQIIDCIKDQKFRDDKKIENNENLSWLTEKPEFYLSSDKDKNHDNILVSDLTYERLSNQTVIMEGVITNNTGSSISHISAQGYLLAPIQGTDQCRFIWSGFLIPKVRYNQKMNPIGNNSTQKFVLQASLPENLSILEDAKWYFTDFSSY